MLGNRRRSASKGNGFRSLLKKLFIGLICGFLIWSFVAPALILSLNGEVDDEEEALLVLREYDDEEIGPVLEKEEEEEAYEYYPRREEEEEEIKQIRNRAVLPDIPGIQPHVFSIVHPEEKDNKDKEPVGQSEIKNQKLEFWTLPEDQAKYDTLNWYQKASHIIENNTEYLQSSKGIANKEDSSITLVSGLFDLGRGDLENSFVRSFDQYVARFEKFMAYQFPKIIFIQPEHYHLYVPLIEKSSHPVHVINTTLDDIRAFPYFDAIHSLRTDPDWFGQASWLADAPQATLPLYNPMVMSKLLWTRDAAKLNPFKTDSFLWIDGGHNCNNPTGIFSDNAGVFRNHFDKLLITFFEYEPNQEIHGFKRRQFLDFIDYRSQYVLVGRGGIFGGSKEYLEVASEVYMLALGATLDEGLMGTEENIFSILLYRFPELVHEYLNRDGGNCAIFQEAVHGPPPLPSPRPVFTIDEDGLDLREAMCTGLDDQVKCFVRGNSCPSYVTPLYLDEAPSQGSCNMEGRFCTIDCAGDEVRWFAHDCSPYNICPPHGTTHWSAFYTTNPFSTPEAPNHAAVQYVYENQPQQIGYGVGSDNRVELTYSEDFFASNQDGALDLRTATCGEDENGTIHCFDDSGRLCPDHVQPLWLNAAPKQYACTLPEHFCTVTCRGEDIFWSAAECREGEACPPYLLTPWILFYDSDPEASKMASMGLIRPSKEARPYDYEMLPPPPFYDAPFPQVDKEFTNEEKEWTRALVESYSTADQEFVRKNGFNLRGAECEILNGKEVCFVSHRGGRDTCPSYVTSLYLTKAKSSCDTPKAYCTIICQDNTEKIDWGVRYIDWCAIQEDPGACKPIPPWIPFEHFFLQMWRDPVLPAQKCESYSVEKVLSIKNAMEPISVGVLTRGKELPVLKSSMDTWEEHGFLSFVDEFIIMVNEVTPAMREFLSYYVDLYGIRVIENPQNCGISLALNWIMGNATNEHFLFLEKDFRLVSPLACVAEQLSVGLDLLESDVAQVVKYRSRYNAGKPNYAEIIYKGRENAVFRIQPNLLCNFYHWVDTPAQLWPNHFDICHEHPLFYCVDSQFCNWTNNPFLIRTAWWFEQFVDKFDELVHPEPSFNLEGFMNGTPDAWNDAGFIVAEGEGLFKHCDTGNMG